MAYTTVDESTFYVQGGFSGYAIDKTMELTDQFFSLDLTKNWTSSSPPWKQLTPASTMTGPKVWGHSMVISKSSVVIWSNQAAQGVFTFSLPDRTWGAPVGLPIGFSTMFKLKAALDPGTSLVYVPYGMGTGENMAVYSSNTRSYLPSAPMTPAVVIAPGSYGYSSVWSTQRNSVLVYGGRTAVASANTLLAEYSPIQKTWLRVETTGELPGELSGHCMVPAYNGTKMIVFGGNHFTRGVQGSIYILDLKSLSWSKGAEAEPNHRRSDMACTASGDNFVAWGGETAGSNVNTFGTPIVYNLKTNAWTTEYLILPESVPGSTPSPSPGSTPPSTTKGINGAGIGGGVAVAVILILAALFVYKRHRSRKDTQRLSSHSLLDQGNDLDKTAVITPPKEAAHAILPAKEEIPPPVIMQYQYAPVTTSGTQEHPALGPAYHYTPITTADHHYPASQAAENQYHTSQAAEHQYPPSSGAEYQYSPSTAQGYHSPASNNQMYQNSPLTTSVGYSLSPVMTTDGQQYSPSISTGSNPYSPTSTAVYHPPPPATPTYPMPPSQSSNVKVERGPDVKVVRNPQTHIPDSEECEPQRSNQPQSHPISPGGSSDERLKQEIAFLKAQQEQQYQMQHQNMERLRLEQQELVELLKKQIKP
ncbi:Acyl-CoA-binding domain-containing protein 5 [Mortierella antarctica]|nr:Acyl-CoA-binding domain-containing protein 5 [Mortierella antarctica]